MPAWIWFVVALLAAGGGALLLLSESSRTSGRRRDRRRWAEQKSWEFVEADPVLPSRWRYGAVAQGGPGRALDLATGAVPGPGGRRLAHVFDHEQAGHLTGIVAAVRGVAASPVALELRLPSAPLPDDAGLDSMGQVGDRYAFVTNVLDGRPLVTDDVARAADRVGDDVPLVWAEDTWVLASTDTQADPERVQEILQALVEVSVALEHAIDGTPVAAGPAPGAGAAGERGDRPRDDRPREDRPRDDRPRDDRPRDDRPRDDRRAERAGQDRGPDRSRDDRRRDPADEDEDFEAFAEGRDDDLPHAGGPTHRDRPGEVPYDIENDEFGPGARSGSRRS